MGACRNVPDYDIFRDLSFEVVFVISKKEFNQCMIFI